MKLTIHNTKRFLILCSTEEIKLAFRKGFRLLPLEKGVFSISDIFLNSLRMSSVIGGCSVSRCGTCAEVLLPFLHP